LAVACELSRVALVYAATPARGVELEVAPSCERIDATQLARLLNIEQRRDSDSGVREIRVSVTCEETVAMLRIERRDDTALPRVRQFALKDVAGEVGARVLSLAVIELLNDLESSPAQPQEPARAKIPEPEARPITPPPREPPPSVRLMAAGAIQTFALDRPLAGGGISVDFLRLSRLGLRLELDVAVGSRNYDLGSASLQLTTMSAQAGYLAVHDSWTARALLGYRFGNGRIVGERASGSLNREGTVTGAFGGPLVALGLGVRSGSWVAELATEAGLVSFPLQGNIDDQESIALDGYWLGFSLNAGALL
jgi:hypothetical protein